MRDNNYLKTLLKSLWDRYFPDVPMANTVIIKFGRKSYRQLGAIKSKRGDNTVSTIVLTKHFSDFNVPEFVVRSTIAHELVHYSHGFNSPLPKLFSDPHRGNIVDKDLVRRGLGDDLKQSKEWLDANWKDYTGVKYRRSYTRRRFLIFPF